MPAPGFNSTTGSGRPSSQKSQSTSGKVGSSFDGNENGDKIFGSCTIGLEQLCKVAMVSSGGITGCTSIVRPLVSNGRPMYALDPKFMKVNCQKPGAIVAVLNF